MRTNTQTRRNTRVAGVVEDELGLGFKEILDGGDVLPSFMRAVKKLFPKQRQ